ncbi:cadherin-99C-like [Haliotis rufescens]|uniref:cadherin-99C-like n=1 Tax=Haliotis rufescens TaxID=6454 RepID=UPI00201F30BD|nr:cadherin-99C-like [Haliotis rufescens]
MVFKLKDLAYDRDVNPNQEEIYGFNINPYYNSDLDGRFHFSLTQTQTGDLSVSRELDFESMSTKYYLLNVSVEDIGKRTSYTVMRVNIADQDDQGPEFYTSDCVPGLCHIRYTASVGTTFTGAITTVCPERVAARDKDTLNASISYSIASSNAPAYFSYFTINNIMGTVSVIQPIGKALLVTLTIEATEVTLLRHTEMTSLTVTFRDPTTPCSCMARSA